MANAAPAPFVAPFVDKIRVALLKHSKSVRDAFAKLDKYSYGYISVAEFRHLLDDPSLQLDLTPVEKDEAVKFVDGFKQSDGRIQYDEFFGAFFSSMLAESLVHPHANPHYNSLRQIFVITRHGARFPLKPFPSNISWPKKETFWKTYGGKLTPAGQFQHVKLGQKLHQQYVHVVPMDPFMVVDDSNFPQFVKVLTSNTDRTLYSAESLLLGMFPSVPHAYLVEGDEHGDFTQTLDGIEIVLLDKPHTPLLHGFKSNPVYENMRTKAFAASPKWKQWAAQEDVKALLVKLWDMTAFGKIDPSKVTPEKALQKFQSIAQQIAVERAHRMGLFANKKDVQLLRSDELLIRAVADEVCRIRYCGNNDDEQRALARHAAGVLPATVISHFKDRAEGKSKLKMVLLSAHDNTIMALLAHLGYKNWPIPQFAANVIFELHQSASNEWSVRFTYDYDPSVTSPTQVQYVALPRKGEVIDWSKASKGPSARLPLADFETYLMAERNSMKDEAQWHAEGHKGFENVKDDEKDDDE